MFPGFAFALRSVALRMVSALCIRRCSSVVNCFRPGGACRTWPHCFGSARNDGAARPLSFATDGELPSYAKN